MRARISRVRGLVRRYQVDRRLPPTVLELMQSTMMLRRRAAVDQRTAVARPVLGLSAAIGASDAVVRRGARRFQAAGRLAVPYHELTHQFARYVADVLAADGLDLFLVEHHGDSLLFGLPLDERRSALAVLAESVEGPGWYLDWADGSRSGTLPLQEAARDRRARRARQWRIYRIDAVGDIAAGPEQAAEVSFWELGTSGEVEMIGTRGHQRFDPRCQQTTETVDGHEYRGRTAFPVGTSFERFTEPIDMVYTWVDGGDEKWRDSFEECAKKEQRDLVETALDPARYNNRDELKYSLRSVWAHCGWVRKIFVVTSGQVPAWLVEDERITVIPHSAILPPEALPTFNSHSIESALHHIDGLAEHFIYFNDDMFIGRPLQPDHFFTSNGLARVFPSGARVPGVEDENTLAVDTAARRGRELLLERFDRVVLDKPLHAPYPLRKSVLEEIDVEFADIVQRTARSRFRSPSDLSVAASFAQHYGMAIGKGILSSIGSEYVHVESGRLSWHLDQMLLGRHHDTFCVNETSHTLGDTSDREKQLSDFFEAYFPIAAPWERGQQTDA